MALKRRPVAERGSGAVTTCFYDSDLSRPGWFDLMTDFMKKLDRYINHRICKMLPSQYTVETLKPITK